MPDPLSHAAIGALLRARAPAEPLAWFAVGSVLPDLSSRLPTLGLTALSELAGFEIPLPLLAGLSVCHHPLPYLLLCWLVALLLPRAVRLTAGLNLAAAGLLHLALDATQRHLEGGYRLLFPLSSGQWELGWIDADWSLHALPWLLLVVAGVFGVRAWRWRRASSQSSK